ncbi:DUF3732 domain-containing protein [Psychrobacter cibarius]|nr:DUF3732 domain-containing protein [Psychrobacter cibarius]
MKKFNILKLLLWSRNGKQRVLNFQVDKINVITGNSNTGKTAILDIIDYCFFASSKGISDSIINENIAWYGLVFEINDKTYTLARKHYTKKVSNEYYFSSIGEVPEKFPTANNTEEALKSIIETEFSIDSNITVAYGGKSLKKGSKISLRYFLMFNTISQDIINDSRNIYFDKQNNSRYREALPRIFDIATGIDSIENILLKEKKEDLEKEITTLERRNSKYKQRQDQSFDEVKDILLEAREMAIISSDEDVEAISELKGVIENRRATEDIGIIKRELLEKDRSLILRKIRNLKILKNQYNTHKENLSTIHDSLKPIDYLKNKVEVRTSYFSEIILNLENELNQLKQANKKVTPIDKQVTDQIVKLKIELESIQQELDVLPKEIRITDTDAKKLIFIGRATEILKLYSGEDKFPENTQVKIDKLQELINKIDVENTEEMKLSTIGLIEEVIRGYLQQYGAVLGNYSKFQPKFDYKNKLLQLRKPNSIDIEPSVGSSSNHLFLHLFFSLAIHEVIFLNKAPYVPPFLVIDQPSRPYFESDDSDIRREESLESDNDKIKQAFNLLNDYIDNRLKENGHFQMIIFEHVSPSFFEDLEHFHLVEEFKNGNALISNEMLNI